MSSFVNHLICGKSEIIGKCYSLHDINKDFGKVKEWPKFSSRVIERESVVKVVISFANREEGNKGIVCRSDLLFERTMAKQMCCRVNEPRWVKNESLSKNIANKEGRQETFIPQEDWTRDGKDESKHHVDDVVVSRGEAVMSVTFQEHLDQVDYLLHLEGNDRVTQEILHVQLKSF